MRKLLVFLLVLVALVVCADLVGRAVAQSKAGEAIATRTGLPAPGVTIHGFSFLAQALPGHYQHISLTSPDVTAGPISGIDTTVELYDVDLPLRDALAGDTSNLVAGSATVQGRLSFADLGEALAQTGAVAAPGPDGAIRVTTTVTVAGRRIPVTADLIASFTSGVLHLKATDVTAAGFAVPDVDDVTRALSVDLPLTGLPFRIDTATLVSTGTDLELRAAAEQVTVSAAG